MNVATRLGFVSATAFAIIGVVYAAVVCFGIAHAGFDEPIVDPLLRIMEILTLTSAPLEWPFRLYVVELLARDGFLGLGPCCLSPPH